MKKSFKVLCLMLVAFMMSGCMKLNVSMSINEDKSMDFTFTEAINSSLLEQSNQTAVDEETLQKYRDNGFTVENYSDNSWTGYTMTKHFSNIDDISSDESVSGSLEDIVSGLEEDATLFTVKKGFFKNTYTASIEFNTDETLDDATKYLDDTTGDTTDTYDDTYSDDVYGDSADYSMIMSTMDLKFMINLPYEALNSNATSLTNDGKTLTWDLVNFKENNFEFAFELYNMTNIYLTVGIAALIVIIIIVLIVKHHKKTKSNKASLNAQKNEPTLNNENVVTPVTSTTETINPTNVQTNTIPNLNNSISATTPEQEVTPAISTPEPTTPVAPVQEAAPVASTPESTTPVQEVAPVETIVPTEATVAQVEPLTSAPQPSTPEPLQENQNTVENTNVGAEPIVTVNSETQKPENSVNTVTTDIFNALPNDENK